MWKSFNPNPIAARVGDCTVRAISKALEQSWMATYLDLCIYGLMQCDMPSSNAVWGKYLFEKGFKRHSLPDMCPGCYTVADFARDHPEGKYILALNGHVVCCEDGCYFDTWDSGQECPVYFWCKEG